MGGNTKIGLVALSAFLIASTTAAVAQSDSQIGVAAAVNPQAQGTPPSSEPRTLNVGVNVQSNERIVTSEGGQAVAPRATATVRLARLCVVKQVMGRQPRRADSMARRRGLFGCCLLLLRDPGRAA